MEFGFKHQFTSPVERRIRPDDGTNGTWKSVGFTCWTWRWSGVGHLLLLLLTMLVGFRRCVGWRHLSVRKHSVTMSAHTLQRARGACHSGDTSDILSLTVKCMFFSRKDREAFHRIQQRFAINRTNQSTWNYSVYNYFNAPCPDESG